MSSGYVYPYRHPERKEVSVDVYESDKVATEDLKRGNNKHVETLSVETDYDGTEDVTARWNVFCEAAQKLPSLKTVIIKLDSEQTEEEYIRMSLLLQHTRQIEELKIEQNLPNNARLFLTYLAQGIADHGALEVITLPELVGIPTESLALFMLTFSTIPNLKYIALNQYDDQHEEEEGDFFTVRVHPFALSRLLRLPSLEVLELDKLEFGDEHAEALLEGLSSRQSSNLRRLELYKCSMTAACLGSVSRGIVRHSNLRVLRLEELTISDYDSDGGVVHDFFDPLSQNTSVNDLFISFCAKEDQAWPGFSFLQENTTIKSLHIEEVGPRRICGGEGFVSLCRSLRTNRFVETLTFGQSVIGDEHVDALAEMIYNNVGLKCLNMCGHQISFTKLAELFVPALAQNSTLETLDMIPPYEMIKARCDSPGTAEFLERVLLVSRLKELGVGRCYAEHMEKLLPIMAQNYHLEMLSLCSRSREEEVIGKKLNVIGTLNNHGRR